VSYQRSAKQKVTRKERRETDRELAKHERERRRRREQQRKMWLRIGAAVVVVAVVAGIGLAVRARIVEGQRGPANMASDGILFTGDGTSVSAASGAPLPGGGTPTPHPNDRASGVVDIVAYVDYGDPASAAFWAANGANIRAWVVQSSGEVTFELRPVALDANRGPFTAAPSTPTPTPTSTATAAPTPTASATPTPTVTPNPLDAGYDYAQRAANAVACVANFASGGALDVNDALFKAQPTFGDAGLTDAQLVTLVTDAGVVDKRVSSCISGHRYLDWVLQASARATISVPFDGVDALASTPLVVVAGQEYTGEIADATAFQTFVMGVYTSVYAAANAGTAGATATPTPTAATTTGASPTPTATATP